MSSLDSSKVCQFCACAIDKHQHLRQATGERGADFLLVFADDGGFDPTAARLDIKLHIHDSDFWPEDRQSPCRVDLIGAKLLQSPGGRAANTTHPHASNLPPLLVSTLNSSPALLPCIITDVNRAWSRVP